MASAHTPGSWRSQWYEGMGWRVQAELPCINGLAAWVTIADVGLEEPSDEMFGGRDHESDARLIAQAPSLLECLEDEIREMRSHGLEPSEKTLETIALARKGGEA